MLFLSPRNGEVILKQLLLVLIYIKHSFSPRNGEVILKVSGKYDGQTLDMFQSPQWGSNSKVEMDAYLNKDFSFSPRNGEVILKILEKMMRV